MNVCFVEMELTTQSATMLVYESVLAQPLEDEFDDGDALVQVWFLTLRLTVWRPAILLNFLIIVFRRWTTSYPKVLGLKSESKIGDHHEIMYDFKR